MRAGFDPASDASEIDPPAMLGGPENVERLAKLHVVIESYRAPDFPIHLGGALAMSDHINRVIDRTRGRPTQAVHMTSDEQTTIRVVLLDRTESPTHRMVQEVMRDVRANEPKQLEADEPKKIKPVENEATKVKDRPIHPGARVGMDWRTASEGPVRDPR